MSTRKKICYISGTRADYGLMVSTLKEIAVHPALSLSVLATGMHLSPKYDLTVREIEADGFTLCGRIETQVDQPSGAAMARGIGIMLQAFVDILAAQAPDAVLLLGDRGEMLAGALAAIHLNIPVVHVHGGERSGTVDEPVRHAISKLSHWHCVATKQSRERLLRMGEAPQQVIVTGAPGLDGLTALASRDRAMLCESVGLDVARVVALMVFHPVLQEAPQAGTQAGAILDALLGAGMQVLALMPNADAGGDAVRATLAAYAERHPDVRVLNHLPRPDFVSWMAAADLMIGNSSSGIIEAASFGTPVINVGLRQNLRERNANVSDVATDPQALAQVVRDVFARGRYAPANVYGDGHAGKRIVELLAALRVTPEILLKTNAY
ncbi:UDP-N-acetylglucosamine 2-epimerase [Laribacter hongkongensis]|uniref:UDP-N-acetylglucosamine 2-epimerase n=1 Tax=Laribacter hongkongensis TaxID=168471 RepID=A0ABD4SQK3_9NEIS|nr:UDP-N-acetylglucosamine 2-epimerase [Laribacter hongkongensis]MCG9026035.1 UDP-N-acetylglucosamine 2-epimerase [Laribacter hongkongensis]MCG9124950.1 UDP-N-acetylglucosamine 2-epimerase [Laribacter hongkongensis]